MKRNDKLSIISKSDFSETIKQDFFQTVAYPSYSMGAPLKLSKMLAEKIDTMCCFEQIQEATLDKTAAVGPLTTISQTIRIKLY